MGKVGKEAIMRELAEIIDEKIGQDMGFVLITFPFNEKDALGEYISNGHNEDIVLLLRDMANALEKKGKQGKLP